MGRNIVEIKGDGSSVKEVVLDSGETIEADGIFVFIGTVPNSSLVERIAKTENGFVVTDDSMETTLPGLFASGDVRNTTFRQVVTAASYGAKAAHGADEYIRKNNL